jgi:flagellar rod protein FlaI
MRSVDKFTLELDGLCDVNHKLSLLLSQESLETEEIVLLVDTREQILQKLLSLIEQDNELAKLPQWQTAVEETQAIVLQMQKKTAEVGMSLQKFQHGKRSIQQYKKFL